jgi:hypothetical protein
LPDEAFDFRLVSKLLCDQFEGLRDKTVIIP